MLVGEDLSPIKPVTEIINDKPRYSVDFSGGVSRATAANRVSTLIGNIACLKDYLRAWCKANGKPFRGEELIDGNINVAIIHDLWNLDKHAGHDRSSRSNLFPRFSDAPQTVLAIKSDSTTGPASVTISFGSGVVQKQGNVTLQISAEVIDKNGNILGKLESIAEKAVSAWEEEFKSLGMKVNDE